MNLIRNAKLREIFSPINILIITVLIDMTGFGMIIPLIPFYAQELNAGPTGIGILLASFSLMQFVFSPFLGQLSDSKGRRPVLILSIITSIGNFIFFYVSKQLLCTPFIKNYCRSSFRRCRCTGICR